jgi:hypothetical protein
MDETRIYHPSSSGGGASSQHKTRRLGSVVEESFQIFSPMIVTGSSPFKDTSKKSHSSCTNMLILLLFWLFPDVPKTRKAVILFTVSGESPLLMRTSG